jgi:hypothetical protein
VELTAGALGSVLAAKAVLAAPATLTASTTQTALSVAVAGAAGIGWSLFGFMNLTKSGLIAGGAIAGLITGFVVQHRSLHDLRAQNAHLLGRLAALSPLVSENARLLETAPDPAELARLRRDHRELLRLRGEVSILRHEAKRPRQALAPETAFTQTTRAGTGPAVRSFKANLRSNVGKDETLVTGGWSTSPGKRTLVLVSPEVEQLLGGQRTVTLTARLFEAPEATLAALGLEPFQAEGEETSMGGILGAEETRSLISNLEQTPGVDIMTAPRVSTADGRQVQVTELPHGPDSTESIPTGSILDFIPHVGADGTSVDLSVFATFNQREVVTSDSAGAESEQNALPE